MEHAPELQDLYLRLVDAYNAGDHDFLAQGISRQEGVVVIGTDPDEWWSAYSSFIGSMSGDAEARRGGVVMVPGEVQGYREGTVGWIVARPSYRIAGDEVPARMTAVAHLENGRWKLVQQHLSFGVPNDAVVRYASSE
jgi:hypothetical protein